MAAYLVLLLAVLSRVLPPAFHGASLNFTAVGGSLLFFGARRPRWQTLFAMLALMATDVYLTRVVYSYPFHLRSYLLTWAWYGMVCLLGHQALSAKPTAPRVTGAVLASATSFFVLSNFVVWAGGHMYLHSLAGLGECYVAAIPFYGNDLMSTAITAGALFGLPVLATRIAEHLRGAGHGDLPAA